jgi:hypothetical protein
VVRSYKQSIENKVIKFRVPQNAGNFLTSSKTISVFIITMAGACECGN